MSRRTAIGALLLTFVVLVASPAAAKGPTEVKVHDPGTGATTLLTFADRGEMEALQLLVGWPQGTVEPRAVRGRELDHVATLTWQHGEGMVAWIDRIYSDGRGTAWVERRDYLSGSGSVVWGRTSAYGMEAVLSQIQHEDIPNDDETTTAAIVAPAAGSTGGPVAQPSRGWDAESFVMGVGMTGLLGAGLVLGAIRRGRRGRQVVAGRGAEPTTT